MLPLTDGRRVLASHQHLVERRVLTQGYSLEFRYAPDRGTEVASAAFIHRRGAGGLLAASVSRT
jgi:hypothetical protein